MRTISAKLHRRLSKQRKQALRRGWSPGQPFPGAPEDLRTIKELVAKGHDPIHAAYVCAQNVASAFAEQVSTLPELTPYYDLAIKAEDEYMPSGPPMSPLTGSYFTTWAFFDLRFGPDQETIGSCLLDLSELLEMDPLLIRALRGYHESRMGIYQARGSRGGRTLLKEVLTNREHQCLITSGYNAKQGDLLFMRLCPPLPDLGDYHVAVTTPYLLLNFSARDWSAYLRRALVEKAVEDRRAALHEFLKFGPSPFFWPEYLFLAYVNYETDVIYLRGLPDVKGSLPHGELAYDEENEP